MTALCKRYYLEDNRKVKKAIRESFSALVKVVGAPKMEVRITYIVVKCTSLSFLIMYTPIEYLYTFVQIYIYIDTYIIIIAVVFFLTSCTSHIYNGIKHKQYLD